MTTTILLLIGYTFYCAASQVSLWYAVKMALWFVAFIFGVVNIVRWLVEDSHFINKFFNKFFPFGAWPIMGLILAGLWLYNAGSYDLRRDLILLAVSFVIAFLRSTEAREWIKNVWQRTGEITSLPAVSQVIKESKPEEISELQKPGSWHGFQIAYRFMLLFWLLSSAANFLTTRPLQHDPNYFTNIKQKSPWREVHVGVALSGGGYRAALMHAGVLHALGEQGVAVTHLTAVSGGSIIGAYYATGGRPEWFRDAVADGRSNVRRSMTDAQNVVRLPFPFRIPGTSVKLFPSYSFSRTDAQAELLDRVLLSGATLSGMRRGVGDAPRLMVCTTDLLSGAFYGFSDAGAVPKLIPHPREKKIFDTGDESSKAAPLPVQWITFSDGHRWREVPLARVVAASGAFPGAFNALEEEMPLAGNDKKLNLLLADGGITDNSALSILDSARAGDGWDVDLAFSSDASALLGSGEGFTALGELTRAVDIVYANVGNADCGSESKKILLSPGALLDMRTQQHEIKDEERQNFIRAEARREIDLLMDKLPPDVRYNLGGPLGLIIKSMPEGKRKRELEQHSAAFHVESTEVKDVNENSRVRDIFADDLTECLDVFLRASTLREHFGEEESQRLFRLGHYLVALRWPLIEQRLNEANKKRQPAVATVAASGK